MKGIIRLTRCMPVFALLILLKADAAGQNTKAGSGFVKWTILNTGKMSVQGRTNINSFSCEIGGYSGKDTLKIYDSEKSKEPFRVAGSLRYRVDEFRSGSAMMTGHIKKTLESEKYPFINIQAISFENRPDMTLNNQNIIAIIEIQLHGVSRRFPVNCQLRKEGPKVLSIRCEKSIKFSDFEINPPSTLGGLVRSQDQLTVLVSFAIRQI